VPDLSHLWQRFVLASTLVFGLALGVGAAVFAYSNTTRVSIGWSVFHLTGVPLWTVTLVPLALVLVVGTLFHWFNSLHHFTEHMRHRRRVHELEAEVKSLRKHLDELLQMPGQSPSTAADEPALPEPAASNGEVKAEPALEPATAAVENDVEVDEAAEPKTAVPSKA
jgi:uncharacterized integral membrane protein